MLSLFRSVANSLLRPSILVHCVRAYALLTHLFCSSARCPALELRWAAPGSPPPPSTFNRSLETATTPLPTAALRAAHRRLFQAPAATATWRAHRGALAVCRRLAGAARARAALFRAGLHILTLMAAPRARRLLLLLPFLLGRTLLPPPLHARIDAAAAAKDPKVPAPEITVRHAAHPCKRHTHTRGMHLNLSPRAGGRLQSHFHHGF